MTKYFTYFPVAVDVNRFDARLNLPFLRIVVLLVRVFFERDSVDELAPSLTNATTTTTTTTHAETRENM